MVDIYQCVRDDGHVEQVGVIGLWSKKSIKVPKFFFRRNFFFATLSKKYNLKFTVKNSINTGPFSLNPPPQTLISLFILKYEFFQHCLWPPGLNVAIKATRFDVQPTLYLPSHGAIIQYL